MASRLLNEMRHRKSKVASEVSEDQERETYGDERVAPDAAQFPTVQDEGWFLSRPQRGGGIIVVDDGIDISLNADASNSLIIPGAKGFEKTVGSPKSIVVSICKSLSTSSCTVVRKHSQCTNAR